MNTPKSVGLGEIVVSQDAQDVLVAYGLGSCLGISMIDPEAKISGLLHAVLPQKLNGAPQGCGKYVDSGIEGLLAGMVKNGANPKRIQVRMAGGANMITLPGQVSSFDIGTRNVESARRVFQQMGITLKAQEVGGNSGRTVYVYVGDCRMTVRVINGVEKVI